LVTALHRQQELTEACNQAEANLRAKSDFLATMSHEIRTPMNGVIAMTSLMLETPLTAEQCGYLETIHNSSESLLTIINDILDFSKIEAGKMKLEQRAFDLRGCVEESLDLLAPRALERNLDLVYEADDDLPAMVEGDAQRLRQVLVNVLGNAVKFTELGDIFVKIEKWCRRPTAGNSRRPAAAFFRARHRHWHPARPAGAAVPRVHAGRRFHRPQIWRHRPRLGHQPAAGGVDGRAHVGGKCAGRRFHLSFYHQRDGAGGIPVRRRTPAGRPGWRI
jgi:hypothetical protein